MDFSWFLWSSQNNKQVRNKIIDYIYLCRFYFTHVKAIISNCCVLEALSSTLRWNWRKLGSWGPQTRTVVVLPFSKKLMTRSTNHSKRVWLPTTRTKFVKKKPSHIYKVTSTCILIFIHFCKTAASLKITQFWFVICELQRFRSIERLPFSICSQSLSLTRLTSSSLWGTGIKCFTRFHVYVWVVAFFGIHL